MAAWRLYSMTMACRNMSTGRKQPIFAKVPHRYKPKAIKEAQQALTEYLHATKSLPFAYAESISKYSLVSLSNLVSNVHWSSSTFLRSVRKYLSFHPINEFEFFFESIGIDYSEVTPFLPKGKFFISEDDSILNAACTLAVFGFPWNKLGNLYRHQSSVFTQHCDGLKSKLSLFVQDYGFCNSSVVGICLAFPFVLANDMGGDVHGLFDDLKRVVIDFDLRSCVRDNVDAWFDVCMKIRLFYDLGIKKGKVGDILGKSKMIFVDFSKEVLVQKIEYFCKFGVVKEDVGLLLLQKPELLSFNFGTSPISVKGFLKHFELSDKAMEIVLKKYPYALGRNKMVNLPHVMRAMDLHVWFFNKLKDEDHELLASYAMSDPREDLDEEYNDCLEKIRASRVPFYSMYKVDFVHGIGFGENALTVNVLANLHGSSSELQERFDCLLNLGVEFSKLVTMIRIMPKILNQSPATLEKKFNFFFDEMGSTMQELEKFPAFLNFNLENRIKPRYRFHMWLTEKGLDIQNYSISSIVATSDKKFLARAYKMHPASPKHWFESFMNKTPSSE